MDAEEALALIDELDAAGETAGEIDGDIDPSDINVLTSSEEGLLDRHLLVVSSGESDDNNESDDRNDLDSDDLGEFDCETSSADDVSENNYSMRGHAGRRGRGHGQGRGRGRERGRGRGRGQGGEGADRGGRGGDSARGRAHGRGHGQGRDGHYNPANG